MQMMLSMRPTALSLRSNTNAWAPCLCSCCSAWVTSRAVDSAKEVKCRKPIAGCPLLQQGKQSRLRGRHQPNVRRHLAAKQNSMQAWLPSGMMWLGAKIEQCSSGRPRSCGACSFFT